MPRPHYQSVGARYVPIDELLDTPIVRVLRAVVRFDWISTFDLAQLLDVQDDLQSRNSHDALMSRLTRDGLVSRRPSNPWRPSKRAHDYHITDLGRRALDRLLKRGLL